MIASVASNPSDGATLLAVAVPASGLAVTGAWPGFIRRSRAAPAPSLFSLKTGSARAPAIEVVAFTALWTPSLSAAAFDLAASASVLAPSTTASPATMEVPLTA